MSLLRSSLLWASKNKRMENIVRSSRAMRPLVSKFMPGETIDDMMRAVRALRAEGTPTVITFLGENVASDAAADQTVAEYEQLLAALRAEGSDTHVSIKLTQFGWDVDPARALDRVRHLTRLAAGQNSVLAVDIESSPYVESTVAGYERLLGEFSNSALCLQAYLHRTPGDIQRLIPLRPYIRLVKGAYRESPTIALQKRDDVSVRYRVLARELLGAVAQGTRVALGTHDVPLINRIRQDARVLGVPESAYEVQMLYGIQESARRSLAAEGLRVRVLISYGKAWYPWFMRRLAEKPANLMLIPRNLIS